MIYVHILSLQVLHALTPKNIKCDANFGLHDSDALEYYVAVRYRVEQL
jgi:hypothetical protein